MPKKITFLTRIIGKDLRILQSVRKSYSKWPTKLNFVLTALPQTTSMVMRYPMTSGMLSRLMKNVVIPSGKMLVNFEQQSQAEYGLLKTEDTK